MPVNAKVRGQGRTCKENAVGVTSSKGRMIKDQITRALGVCVILGLRGPFASWYLFGISLVSVTVSAVHIV